MRKAKIKCQSIVQIKGESLNANQNVRATNSWKGKKRIQKQAGSNGYTGKAWVADCMNSKYKDRVILKN